MTREWFARLLVVASLVGLSTGVFFAGREKSRLAIEVHAAMPEVGGWMPDRLTASVNTPLELRLTSDDVVHGFAIGQADWPAVDVKPGQVTPLTLVFDQPGTYTYYCTRWCGPNHWRMRGTIEVDGPKPQIDPPAQPLYLQLGLDLDASTEVEISMERTPSASRGAALNVTLPPETLERETYLSKSPLSVWNSLRQTSAAAELTDAQVWDLVAMLWRRQSTPDLLRDAEMLYAQNCAACHGEKGAGDGVMAVDSADPSQTTETIHSMSYGHEIVSPPDFTDPRQMLGSSPARLQGKIMRGGMGTGMPYWGPIFTESQTWALVDYLWQFQFQYDP